MTKVQTYTLQSVERALTLLEAIARATVPVRAKELADEHGLSLPTAYHLLNTLLSAGYVRKEGRTYVLGTKIPELYDAFQHVQSPGRELRSLMHQVADLTGETTYVSRWQFGDVTIVAVADGSHTVRVADVRVGLRGHAYARASGKILLAWGPPSRLATCVSGGLEALTPHTICDYNELTAELDRIRAQGYALDNEEFMCGVCCIAAPVLDGGYAMEALTVTIPSQRMHEGLEATTEILLRAARSASRTTASRSGHDRAERPAV